MTPSLTQVLTRGGAATSSLHPAYLLAGLAFFFLAAFSAAKGLEIYRRSRLVPKLMADRVPPLAEIQAREKIEKMSFIVDELKCEKEKLAGQNSLLQNKIKELNDAFYNVKQARDTLEKSNLALLRETAKLKTEKEELVLKTSQPLLSTAGRKKTVKSEKKAKKGGRRPKRVSRKK